MQVIFMYGYYDVTAYNMQSVVEIANHYHCDLTTYALHHSGMRFLSTVALLAAAGF